MASPARWKALTGSSLSRYVQSGLAVYALDLGLFSLLNWLAPAHYATWTVAGRIAGAAAGFFLHNSYSFAGEKAHSKRRMAAHYLILLVANALLSVLLLRLSVEGLGIASWLARPVIDVLIIALAFLGSRLWVFRAAKA